MQARLLTPALSCVTLAFLAHAASAQANEIPGLDVKLGKMDTIRYLGREGGSFPGGVNGIALATTSCNVGTVEVPWFAPMDPNHPFIAFLLARESEGRLEQISDYSYVKHGFFALTSNFCGTCIPPGSFGDWLGINCSDTYAVENNGDQFFLGPPEEIDPWLGMWDPICSHFDRGEPAVPPPADCNGIRSLSSSQAAALNPVGHRIRVLDTDMDVSGASFYYQGYYAIKSEPEANRENNWGTRSFNPTWNGASWFLASTSGFQQGSVLERWSGATINSVKNGTTDGRVYVAYRVTGPTGGLYHYEYAIQNRDNSRAVDSFSVPLCQGARILNVGFHDPDQAPANDWVATVGATDVTFSTPDNPIGWNTLFNFYFDSDAAPADASAALGQFAPGPGLGTLNLTVSAPTELFNVYLGDGCILAGGAPILAATGTPPRATIGNSSFGMESTGNVPGQLNLLVIQAVDGSVDLGGGCTQWFGGLAGGPASIVLATTAAGGTASYGTPIPPSPVLEGRHVNCQTAGFNPGGGALFGIWDLSNGLRVRIGDAVSSCP